MLRISYFWFRFSYFAFQVATPKFRIATPQFRLATPKFCSLLPASAYDETRQKISIKNNILLLSKATWKQKYLKRNHITLCTTRNGRTIDKPCYTCLRVCASHFTHKRCRFTRVESRRLATDICRRLVGIRLSARQQNLAINFNKLKQKEKLTGITVQQLTIIMSCDR